MDPAEILALFFAFERIYFEYYYQQNVGEDQPAANGINIGMIYKGMKQFMKTRNERILAELEETTTDEILWSVSLIEGKMATFGF